MALFYRLREKNLLTHQRIFKDRRNPLEVFNDVRFKELFRLNKPTVIDLVKDLSDNLQHPTNKSAALPPLLQVCIALNYYGTASFQSEVSAIIQVDQSTASRAIWRVSCAILAVYRQKIRTPGT